MSSKYHLINHWITNLQPDRWSEFVYVSDSVVEGPGRTKSPPDVSNHPLGASVLPLSMVQIGDRVRIVALNCGESNNRLMGMGFIPNVVLEVISCTTTGSVIVALQDQRLGLGAEMAQQIQVMPATQPSNESLSSFTSQITTMKTSSDSATVRLRDAAIGATLRVIGYEPTSRDYKRKLLAMGLTPGTELRVTRHAPLGDPTEIEVRDFHLSLRKDEADALIVAPIAGEKL